MQLQKDDKTKEKLMKLPVFVYDACKIVVSLDSDFLDDGEDFMLDMDEETFERTFDYCIALLQSSRDSNEWIHIPWILDFMAFHHKKWKPIFCVLGDFYCGLAYFTMDIFPRFDVFYRRSRDGTFMFLVETLWVIPLDPSASIKEISTFVKKSIFVPPYTIFLKDFGL